MEKDLDTLLKVALSATPGPWKAEPYLYGMTGEGHRIRVTSPSTDDLHNLADDILQEDAEFIATFDPPTVLELIDQIKYYKRENETLAALGKANHENRADITTRLEQSEQTVARVRVLSRDYVIPESVQILIDRALDGHTKQLGGTPTGEFADVCSCGKSYWPCTALDGDTRV